MGLIRNLFWFALFLVSTFCFLVLFENGPENFQKNAEKEFESIKKYASSQIQRKKDNSDQTAE